ncbi:hypothetical protein ACG04R_13730 [Roseateles sp. BYS78W]|uniref:RNA polymerase alpha subunit C-terminal domain-containing protein n=1 Tax=Pelomonas candidula TaxID=3299025 RepID=A0ABW7HCU2_9BURK
MALSLSDEAAQPEILSESARLTQSKPSGLDDTVSISSETYARLLSLADQAPLECLPLTSRTLDRAKTLGYNQIGQIRTTPTSRLVGDLGEERAEELQRALHDFGMRQPGAVDAPV